MTEKRADHQDIQEAQEYLTRKKDGAIELIVGIDYLSENHSRQEIVRFLKDYLGEKEKSSRVLSWMIKRALWSIRPLPSCFGSTWRSQSLKREWR